MARKRFRSTQRNEPVTDRSFQEYLYSTAAPQTSRTELMRLVRGGEDTFLELKVKLSNPERIAQEIVAMANTGGGVIVFGVNDQLRVEGIEDGENLQDELVRICREEIAPPIVPFIDRVAFDNGRRIIALDISGKRRPTGLLTGGSLSVLAPKNGKRRLKNSLLCSMIPCLCCTRMCLSCGLRS